MCMQRVQKAGGEEGELEDQWLKYYHMKGNDKEFPLRHKQVREMSQRYFSTTQLLFLCCRSSSEPTRSAGPSTFSPCSTRGRKCETCSGGASTSRSSKVAWTFPKLPSWGTHLGAEPPSRHCLKMNDSSKLERNEMRKLRSIFTIQVWSGTGLLDGAFAQGLLQGNEDCTTPLFRQHAQLPVGGQRAENDVADKSPQQHRRNHAF